MNFILIVVLQDPAGIFELIEVVGNGTYGQVYKVMYFFLAVNLLAFTELFC